MKCFGRATFVFSAGPRQGEVVRCTRCSTHRGKMTGHDIARYWAWSTDGYRSLNYRMIVESPGPDGTNARHIRTLAANTLVFTLRDGDWVPLPERKILPRSWVLIPRKGSHELLVCRVLDFEPIHWGGSHPPVPEAARRARL